MILTLLGGCLGRNNIPEQIEIKRTPVKKPELVLPNADQLQQRELEWILITPETNVEVFDKVKDTGQPLVLFGLTGGGYERLALNMSDIRMYISQQKAIIDAYQNYYVESERTMDNAVLLE